MRTYEDRLLRVLDHIHDNPAGDLSLDALAAADAAPSEVYLNDPSDVPPEDLLTDIVVPLR